MAHDDRTWHHRAGPPIYGDLDKFPSSIHEQKGFISVADLEVELETFLHVRCPNANHECPECTRNIGHIDSLIVAVDGACRGNGTAAAQTSACGVFLSRRDDTLNRYWRVNEQYGNPHTNQRAELHAAIGGIDIAMDYVREGGQIYCDNHSGPPCTVKHLVIKSDSAYVVNGITDYVKKWQVNGWRNARGEPVVNQDLWRFLLDRVNEVNNWDAVVSFWHVKRADNQDADYLANFALDN